MDNILDNASVLLILSIFLPLISAAAINLFGAYKNIRDVISIISGCVLSFLVYSLSIKLLQSEVIEAKLFQILPGLPILFHIEPLGLIYAGLASSLWVITSLYSIGYLRYKQDLKQTRFFIYLSISIGCSLGIAFSGNLLTMLIFYEALTFATYPLVAHKGDDKSIKGARTYLGYLLGSSIVFLIPAIIITQTISGSMEFTYGGVFSNGLSPTMLAVLILLFAYGIGKAALMPMHRWLPAAMVAPTPVSALLHAVAVVKAGVFCLLKVLVYIFGLDMLKFSEAPNLLLYLSTITIITASIIAIFQDNLKKRLAYSTVAQLSYIILAGALFTKAGILAAGEHMVAHAVAKITLFFAAGAIIIVSHKENISELNGMGRKMPLVFICFAIASLSLMGMPGLAGGESKHLISEASADIFWVDYLLYLGIALNFAYLAPITYRAFFKTTGDTVKYNTPLTIKLALILTTILVLGFSFYSYFIKDILGMI